MSVFFVFCFLFAAACSDDSKPPRQLPTEFFDTDNSPEDAFESDTKSDVDEHTKADTEDEADTNENNDTSCIPETDLEICQTNNAVCGQLIATDRCGNERTIESCGTCTDPQSCGAPGTENQCGCAPETDAELCEDAGAVCGQLVVTDGCGIERTVDNCGTCKANSNEVCAGQGTANQCECVGETDAFLCADNYAVCGQITVTDRCNATRKIDNCGTCTGEFEVCAGLGDANRCECVPETDSQLCAINDAVCGSLVATDRCNRPRTIDNCGTCDAPELCAGLGTANQCECVPETDIQLCDNAGAVCGELVVTDSCGKTRTVDHCGSCAAPEFCAGLGSANQCECVPETDIQLCDDAGATCGEITVTDICGNARTIDNCGSCDSPEFCAGMGAVNQCECVPETNTQLCAANDAVCGQITTTDICGNPRTIDNCGNCSAPEFCAGLGTANQCECVPETDIQLCDNAGAVCGEITVTDVCGNARTVDNCGTCSSPEFCAGQGAANQCECVAESDIQLCDDAGAVCGQITTTDICGNSRTIDNCGTCDSPEFCAGLGTANQCECVPETDTQLCADNDAVCGQLTTTDICGNSRTVNNCGTCDNPDVCGGLGTANQCECVPETNTQLCQANDATCGEITVTDVCGTTRTVDQCGTCNSPQTCGGNPTNTPNMCGCTPESDAIFCSANQAACGPVTARDNCGVMRTLTSCGSCTAEFETCGGSPASTPNVCGCTPTTCKAANVVCGDIQDGCGNTLQCDHFCVDDLSSGEKHACAISSGKAKCWGSNSKGQLGNGLVGAKIVVPVNVTGLTNIVQIASGGRHTCARLSTGNAVCWGDNARGQLGVGTTVDTRLPANLVEDITNVEQIALGDAHSCALTNGIVKCWGSNTFGQIGNEFVDIEPTANVAKPIAVSGLGSDVKAIAAGTNHTCALKNDNTVYCWGQNSFGQIGNLVIDPLLPHPAVGFTIATNLTNQIQKLPYHISELSNVTQITAGANSTCALTASQDVYCWGAMIRKGTCAAAIDPSKKPTDCAIFPMHPAGVPVVNYTIKKNIGSACPTAGDCPTGSSCNSDNRCQSPDTYSIGSVHVDRTALRPVLVSTNIIHLIDSGPNHLCMITDEADTTKTNVMCLGLNAKGQLGDGTNNAWPFPTAISAEIDGSVVRVHTLSLGAEYSCSITEANGVKCWGSNADGQLGNPGITNQSYIPLDVIISHN